jgi:hypothetical protein
MSPVNHNDGEAKVRRRAVSRRIINTATFLLTLLGVGFFIAAFLTWRGYI